MKVPVRRPGKRSATVVRMLIPKRVAPGRYRVLACADVRRTVRETRESNNCKASTRIRVTAATGPLPPPPPDVDTEEMRRQQGAAIAAEFDRAGAPTWFLQAPPAIGRTVQFGHDEARSVTRMIGPAGGTLEVRTAVGDTLRLTVPPDALLADVAITATPVTSASGASDVGARATGLQLLPEGLTLLEPATLEVTTADATATPAIGLAGRGDGTGVVPALVLPDTDRTALSLMHFSHHVVLVPTGEGGFTADYLTDAEYAAVLNQRVVQLITEERNAQLAGEEANPGVWDEVHEILDEYYTSIIVPLVRRATTDCAYAEANIHTALAHARQMAMLNPEDDPDAAAQQQFISDGLQAAMQNCWEEALEECLRMDPDQYRRLVALARQLQLTGVEDPRMVDALDLAKANWCKDVNGWIDYTEQVERDEAGGHSTSTMTARIWFSSDAHVQFADQLRSVWTLEDTDDSRIDVLLVRTHKGSCASSVSTWDVRRQPFDGVPHESRHPFLSVDFTGSGGEPVLESRATVWFFQYLRDGVHEWENCRGESGRYDEQVEVLDLNDEMVIDASLDPTSNTITLAGSGEDAGHQGGTAQFSATIFAPPPAD